MTINVKHTSFIIVVILTNLAMIFLPNFMKDKELLRLVQIIYVAVLICAIFGRIFYLRKINKPINIKEILILIVITALSLLIGGILFRAYQG